MSLLTRTCYTAPVVYNGLGTARANGAVVIQTSNTQRHIVAVTSAAEAAEAFPEAKQEQVGFAILPVPANAYVDLCGLGIDAVKEYVNGLEHPCCYGLVSDDTKVVRKLLADPQHEGIIYWQAPHLPKEDDNSAWLMNLAQTLNTLRQLANNQLQLGLCLTQSHLKIADTQRLCHYLMQTQTPLQLNLQQATNLADYLDDSAIQTLLTVKPSVHLSVDIGTDDDNVLEAVTTHLRKHACTVIYCPQAYLTKGARFPWKKFMAQGVEVAFGSGQVVRGQVVQEQAGEVGLERLVHIAQQQQGTHASPLALLRAAVKGGYRALQMTPPRFIRGDMADGLVFWQGTDS
ncbi:MAG: hypothetical protein AAF267_20835 [Deinococcota bacterium]